ncbi:MAG: ferredoxin [Acidimicrobiales bacterium]|nr:ferredoxin [Acidimicrobiales bacterium]
MAAEIKIEIDREKCMGSGNCSFWAPATFDLDDEGVAIVVDPAGDGDDGDKVVLAAQGCPTQAISVWRDGEKLA